MWLWEADVVLFLACFYHTILTLWEKKIEKGKKKRKRKKVEMHLCIKAFILLPFRTHCKFVCNTTLMDLGVEKNFCFVRKQQRKKKPNVIKHC